MGAALTASNQLSNPLSAESCKIGVFQATYEIGCLPADRIR